MPRQRPHGMGLTREDMLYFASPGFGTIVDAALAGGSEERLALIGALEENGQGQMPPAEARLLARSCRELTTDPAAAEILRQFMEGLEDDR